MDPVSALGLVANVVALVDIGVQIVAIGVELSSSANGQTENAEPAQYLAREVKDVADSIKRTRDTSMIEHPDHAEDDDDRTLRTIADKSIEIAKKLSEELEKIRPQSKGRRDIFRASVATFWRSQTIEDYRTQLKEYRDILNTRFVVGLKQHFQQVNQNIDDRFVSLDERTQELAEHLLLGTSATHDKLTKLDFRLHKTHTLVEAVLEDRTRQWQPTDTEALHEAAKQGDTGALKMLLSHTQVNVNALDQYCRTPLHSCTSAFATTQLINMGGKINEQDFEGSTPLHTAVKGKHLEVVKVLLARGADPELADYKGNIPLAYSVDIPALTFMLRNGADVEARDKTFLNNTGLFHMAWLGDIDGVKFYLRQNAEVDCRNSNGETCLAEAARHGDLEVVQLLLESGADIESTQGDGYRPLLRAVAAGRQNVISELLIRGADAEAKNCAGHTAIAEAAFLKRWPIVRMLLEHGVDLTARDKEDCTVLHRAVRAGEHDLARRMLVHGASPNLQCKNGNTSLFDAASKGYADLVERMLKCRGSSSIATNSGHTPLTIASALGHANIVELLLDHGADASQPVDLSRPGAYSWTPLAHAAYNGHSEVVTLLLKSGADTNTRDYQRLTPLHRAAGVAAAKSDIVSQLLAHGSNVDARDSNGITPLAVACRHCSNASVIRKLLEHGANPESLSNYADGNLTEKNFTPLMHTVLRGQGVPSTISLLALRGANLNAQTSSGRTALHIALKSEKLEMVDALVEAGADVNIVDNFGRTPLHEAARRGFREQAKRLIKRGASLTCRDHHGKTAEITA